MFDSTSASTGTIRVHRFNIRRYIFGCCGYCQRGLRQQRIQIGRPIVEHHRVTLAPHFTVHGHVIPCQRQLRRIITPRFLKLRRHHRNSLSLRLRPHLNPQTLPLRRFQHGNLGRLGLVPRPGQITLRLVHQFDLDPLGRELRATLFSFGLQHQLPARAFGGRLLVHRFADHFVRADFGDFVPSDFESPGDCCFLDAALY
mmetsp:Transcript_21320/g.21630  ORF Transcript_21320/g.21630 Transcript_21320/m.21630 type:complete len:200 (-) Transcript_21320:655-1254(-)